MMDVSHSIPRLVKSSNYQAAYKVNNKLDRPIHCHKDRSRATERTNATYKINCPNRDAPYAGQTRRQLNTRVKEHRSHIQRITTHPSPITDHRPQFNHEFDWDNVTTPDADSNHHKRPISEITHSIKNQINGSNLQSDTNVPDNTYPPLPDPARDKRFRHRPIPTQPTTSSSHVTNMYLDDTNYMTPCLIN